MHLQLTCSCMPADKAKLQDWGLSQEQHHSCAVLSRFRQNVGAVHGTDKVSILQQTSWAGLAALMTTDMEAFQVSIGKI